MNCKPGDLAYIKRQPYLGHFVTVLYWTKPGRHTLPDGYGANNILRGGWVVEKHVGTFTAPLTGGGRRSTRYAVVDDKYLQPIRPGDVSDKEVRELYEAPKQPETMA